MKRKYTKHGMLGSLTYNSYLAMMERCYNEACEKYPKYGGRGIKVCQRWRDSILAFAADMGLRPSRKHTLDRIENDGDYEPGNCRWATAEEQQSHTSRTRMVTINGVTKCVQHWCRETGVKYITAIERMNRGWDPVLAVTKPADPLAGRFPQK